MADDIVVLVDQDGTNTWFDQRTFEIYLEAAKEHSAKLLYPERDLDQAIVELDPVWKAAQKKVEENPLAYGWLDQERRIVAPPTDMMVLAHAMVGIICDERGEHANFTDAGQFASRITLQTAVYRAGYAAIEPNMRPEVPGIFAALNGMSHVRPYIVSNSSAQKIEDFFQGKVRPEILPPVTGNARKFVLGDNPTELHPLSYGGARPVFVGRDDYVAAIDRVRGDTPWERIVAVGDHFELDLAEVLHRGGVGILVDNHYTLPQERNAVLAYQGRGHVVNSLQSILQLLPKS